MSTDDEEKVVRLPSAKTPVFDIHHFLQTTIVELRILRRPDGKYEYAKVSLRYVEAKLVGITVYGYSDATTIRETNFSRYAIPDSDKGDILVAIDEYRNAIPFRPLKPKK